MVGAAGIDEDLVFLPAKGAGIGMVFVQGGTMTLFVRLRFGAAPLVVVLPLFILPTPVFIHISTS
jgi:hypothetical protein